MLCYYLIKDYKEALKMDIINKLIELIQNFITAIKDLVASIRAKNDEEN